MKSFQEKEKKLYKLLNKLNNFDVSQIQNKDQLKIENLVDQKNQLEIEKNNLEKRHQALSLELKQAQKRIEDLESSKRKDNEKHIEFNQKIDELNQETEYLIEEIDKWEM